LRTRVTELTREQYRLRAEIANRERRIRALEVALRRAQAGELADIARRREELERQIQEEREAIRRAEERLQNVEQRPPTPPPSTTPPNNAAPSSGSATPPAFR
jgi:chromosome segregation ATPase